MKIKIKILICTLIITFPVFSQVATSIANGNWTSPTTWSCTCVPMPGYTITINHSITLDTDFGFTSGGITINSSGALLDDIAGRDMWVNGGAFSNNGNFDIQFLLTSAGSFANAGTLTASAFSNKINFTNIGTIHNLDSMINTATIVNFGQFLNIDSITNNGTFINNGVSSYNQFTNNGIYTNFNQLTFTDITNNGVLTNSDSMLGLNNMWNQGEITNNLNALITLNKSLLNKNILFANASINNNGRIQIADSYYNYDTIKGVTGGITVQDSSVNYGFMLQTFDFCDYTPSPLPNIDYNFGIVSSGITYCVNTGFLEDKFEDVIVYPNPASTQIIIDLGDKKNYEITLYGSDGRKIFMNGSRNIIDVSDLSEGLYFVCIKHNTKSIIKKVQVIK